MATSFLDPMQMWREAVTKLENDVNTAFTGSAKSQEVVSALHQFSSMTMGLEQIFEKAIGGYLRRANLPSRKEILELAQSLQRIEDKLDRLLPAEAPAGSRPARTRRPPAAVATPEPVPAPEPAPARAPTAKTAAKRARRAVPGGKKG